MAYAKKTWDNTTATPSNADGFNDLEERIEQGIDSVAGGSPVLARIQLVANQTFTAAADVAGGSITFDVPANRNIKLIVDGQAFANNNAAGLGVVTIMEGATTLATVSEGASTANEHSPLHRESARSPTAGPHTYKLQCQAFVAGTTTLHMADNSPLIFEARLD